MSSNLINSASASSSEQVIRDVREYSDDLLGELPTLPRTARGATFGSNNRTVKSSNRPRTSSGDSAPDQRSSASPVLSWLQSLNPFGPKREQLIHPSSEYLSDDDGVECGGGFADSAAVGGADNDDDDDGTGSNSNVSPSYRSVGQRVKENMLEPVSESCGMDEAGYEPVPSTPHTPMTPTIGASTAAVVTASHSHPIAEVFSLFRRSLMGRSSSRRRNAYEKDSQSVASASIQSSHVFDTTRSQDHSIRTDSSGESAHQRIMSLEAGMMAAKNTVREASVFDIWAFVVAVVVGTIYYGWNAGFAAGFGSYAMAQLLVALAFVILACSIAEIVSAVSFSGGAYGMARVVLGFHAGFTIAMFEYMEYVMYLSSTAQYIGESVAILLEVHEAVAPVFSLLFLVLCGAIVLAGDRWFWRVNGTLAVTSLLVLLAYCLGTLPHVDFAQNATLGANRDSFVAAENWFVGGLRGFIHVLPFTTWMFGGLESAALLSDMTAEPRKNVPNGIVAGTLTLLAMGLLMLFITASLPPGLRHLSDHDHMMSVGWHFMGVTDGDARWLTLPAQVAMGFGFQLAASKLLRAMITSNLFPCVFSTDENTTESKAVYLTVTLVLAMCFAIWSMEQKSISLQNIPILFAQVTYLSNLFAFYKLRTDFSSRENMFRSPFGVVGAAYAAFMFVLVAISVIGFQTSILPPIIVLLVFVALTIYYFAYAKHRQRFSDDEQKSLLVLHVIRNNRKKKRGNKTSKR